MSEYVEELLENIINTIPKFWDEVNEFQYKKVSSNDTNIYFISKNSIITIKGKISQIKATPIAMIVENNSDYTLCPIYDRYEEYVKKNYKKILEDFVDKNLI